MERTREFLIWLGVIFLSDGRRRWPDELKARIVAETLPPGATVNDVAAKYGSQPNHVSSWRRRAKEGDLVLPVLEEEAAFAPLVVLEEPVSSPVPDAAPSTQTVEIAAGGILPNWLWPHRRRGLPELVRALGVVSRSSRRTGRGFCLRPIRWTFARARTGFWHWYTRFRAKTPSPGLSLCSAPNALTGSSCFTGMGRVSRWRTSG